MNILKAHWKKLTRICTRLKLRLRKITSSSLPQPIVLRIWRRNSSGPVTDLETCARSHWNEQGLSSCLLRSDGLRAGVFFQSLAASRLASWRVLHPKRTERHVPHVPTAKCNVSHLPAMYLVCFMETNNIVLSCARRLRNLEMCPPKPSHFQCDLGSVRLLEQQIHCYKASCTRAHSHRKILGRQSAERARVGPRLLGLDIGQLITPS